MDSEENTKNNDPKLENNIDNIEENITKGTENVKDVVIKKETDKVSDSISSDSKTTAAEAPEVIVDSGNKPNKEKNKVEDFFKDLEGEDDKKVKVYKAKGSKNISDGIVHINASFNNTIVSISDIKGNVIGWSSSGKMGFKGSRKSTAFAAQQVSQDACKQAMGHGLKSAKILIKGPGAGREPAVRSLQTLGLDIKQIKDVTPIPHNGCRPPKARRV